MFTSDPDHPGKFTANQPTAEKGTRRQGKAFVQVPRETQVHAVTFQEPLPTLGWV